MRGLAEHINPILTPSLHCCIVLFSFFSGVKTHFTGLFGAAYCDKPGVPLMEEIVGAKSNEVALLNGLTVNLHFLMNAFYKPTKNRWKILIEEHAFPSDRVKIRAYISK